MQNYTYFRNFKYAILALLLAITSHNATLICAADHNPDKYVQLEKLTQLDIELLAKAHSDMGKILELIKTDKYAFPFSIDDALKVSAWAVAFALYHKYVTTAVDRNETAWSNSTLYAWKTPIMDLVKVGGAVFALDRFKEHFKRFNRFFDAWIGYARDRAVAAVNPA